MPEPDTDAESKPQYVYRPAVLEDLARHGIVPRSTTSPRFVRAFLNDIYRYELRILRDRVLRHEMPHTELSAHVIVLRRRYLLMSLPVDQWVLPSPADDAI